MNSVRRTCLTNGGISHLDRRKIVAATYLFSPEGLSVLTRCVRANTLFIFNLDGILVPDVPEHFPTQVTDRAKTTLQRLMNIAKVTVITGRSRKEALAILGFEPHLLIGYHGAEWPWQENGRNWQQVKRCLKWRERLYDFLSDEQGVEIEFKGESISIHYRKADDPERACSIIDAAIDKLEPRPRKLNGTHIVNLLQCESLAKREALLAAMDHFGSRNVVFCGDEETAKEVFESRGCDLLGIHVGKAGLTSASLYLRNQSEMPELLHSMVGLLETHCQMGNKDTWPRNFTAEDEEKSP